jgi:hypothetical protein
VPLLSDPTENTDTFLAFQSTQVIEMKGLILQKGSMGMDGVLEQMRSKLVAAIKNGQTLLVRLTDALPNLNEHYNKEDFFPTDKVFDCKTVEVDDEVAEQHFGGFGGQIGALEMPGACAWTQPKDLGKPKTKGVFGVQDKACMLKVFREKEFEAGSAIARPGFRVVVSTNLPVGYVRVCVCVCVCVCVACFSIFRFCKLECCSHDFKIMG